MHERFCECETFVRKIVVAVVSLLVEKRAQTGFWLVECFASAELLRSGPPYPC